MLVVNKAAHQRETITKWPIWLASQLPKNEKVDS